MLHVYARQRDLEKEEFNPKDRTRNDRVMPKINEDNTDIKCDNCSAKPTRPYILVHKEIDGDDEWGSYEPFFCLNCQGMFTQQEILEKLDKTDFTYFFKRLCRTCRLMLIAMIEEIAELNVSSNHYVIVDI
jgi:hypothetical protein